MITGYNHNIKYKDRIFHVQTEDSGVQNPHIITHIFVGGNIIETRKTSYADIAKSDRLEEVVIEMMQEQHKSMLKDLIAGRYDPKIAVRAVHAASLYGPAPLNVEAGAQHRESLFAGAARIAGAAAAPPPKKPIPIPAAAQAAVPPPLPHRPAPPKIVGPPPPAPASPLASFFGDVAPGEKIIEAETLQKAFDSRNQSAIDSIFGEDLISEKSLDEVILSYLAEDMREK
jgi:hypothetical protein